MAWCVAFDLWLLMKNSHLCSAELVARGTLDNARGWELPLVFDLHTRPMQHASKSAAHTANIAHPKESQNEPGCPLKQPPFTGLCAGCLVAGRAAQGRILAGCWQLRCYLDAGVLVAPRSLRVPLVRVAVLSVGPAVERLPFLDEPSDTVRQLCPAMVPRQTCTFG